MNAGRTHEISAPGYNLDVTLASGQAFRWFRCGRDWLGVAGNRLIRLRQVQDHITAELIPATHDIGWLRRYLQIDQPVHDMIESLPADDLIARAVTHCAGLHILKQEPWECLASFLLTSARQIPQIQKTISELCRELGPPIKDERGDTVGHGFPPPTAVADAPVRVLRRCGLGFRAVFLKQVAALVDSGKLDLAKLERLDTEAARQKLLELPGVGPKIADCVLLFAYNRYEAFPVDTWILKAMRIYYFGSKPVSAAQVREFAQARFGRFAGVAQQYIYHYTRTALRPQLDLAMPRRRRVRT